ncbi:MAG TPA: fused MFS/spermidine synthase [Candidatus Acidoferrales bacterium]|nr:fused MFS/spermidine synthase [Candidatus Acidoferrales bacterium]
MLPFALTIFLSAFLLFQVQLLLAKYILPWFGGSPAVWTTCNLFFQALLLGGYAYGHLISSRLSPRAQKRLHQMVLFASLAVLGVQTILWKSPLTPEKSWQPANNASPVLHIIFLLAVSVGLPFLVLSSTAPLLQAWLRQTHSQDSVYRLYALSNFGSLLALLTYPVLVEPWLALRTQAYAWAWGFLVFALGCGFCAEGLEQGEALPVPVPELMEGRAPEPGTPPPGKMLCALWLGLAACGSALFLATTNQLCQEVAVVPFLWVLPLSLYLLSFVLCFERKMWYARRWFHPAFGAAVLAACFVLYDGAWRHLTVQVAVYSATLFVCCMVCHGELARLKPSPQHLTLFYLMVAGGGAVGGVFVALLAPRIFSGFWEYQAGLGGAAALLVVVLLRDPESWLRRGGPRAEFALLAFAVLLPVSILLATPESRVARGLLVVLVILVLLALLLHLSRKKREDKGAPRRRAVWILPVATLGVLGAVLAVSAGQQPDVVLARSRNFYGVLTIRLDDAGDSENEAYELRSGGTIHGVQFRAEDRRGIPTTYYGEDSGVGLAVAETRKRANRAPKPRGLRIGVVGLGIGTMAAYGRRGDKIRFYEINPRVIQLATDSPYFTYVKDCLAKVEMIRGDARISMTRELERGERQKFDVLAIDAFTGDAIPVHLLTREAFAVYLQHLAPGGILAIHISNRFLDLEPVARRAAEEFGLQSVLIVSEDNDPVTYESDWVLLSRDAEILHSPTIWEQSEDEEKPARRLRLWTDDYSNLFQVLKLKW